MAPVRKPRGCSTALCRGSSLFLKAVMLARCYLSAGELASVTQAESPSVQREEVSRAVWRL